MFARIRTLPIALLALALYAVPSVASADYGFGFGKSKTVLDVLQRTDGAQAVVAAVLVVDEAEVLPFSLAELLDDRRAEVVLFAPSNAAFEDLLGLDPGSLDGLSIEEVKDALPGLLPSGVGAAEVAAILLKHAALPSRANLFTASEKAPLREGPVTVADESVFPVGIGASGVQVNYETTIIRADLSAQNGVVHFIDTVILDGLL
jgi:hypothetical protein